jgi:hypothetical protein
MLSEPASKNFPLPVTGAGGRSDDAKGGVVFDLKINQRLQVLASPADVRVVFM